MSRRIGASLLTMLLFAGCAQLPAGAGTPSVAPISPPPPSVAPSSTPTPSDPSAATLEPSASPTLACPTPDPLQPNPVGAFLLQHIRWGDTGGGAEVLAVLQDGRILATRWEESGAPRLVVRQLTPSGVAFVRAAVANVGLFDKTQARQVIKPFNFGGAGEALWFTSGDTTVKVCRVLAPPDAYAPSAAWDRFDALVKAMANPETWIPASGWVAGSWQPYRAD